MSDPPKAGRVQRIAIAVLGLAVAAMPVAVAIRFVDAFRLEVPLSDHWLLLGFYGRVVSGEARFLDFLAPHGSHVPVFARLVLAGIAYATDLSYRAEIYAAFGLALLTAWMIDRLSVHTMPAARPVTRAVLGCFTTCVLFAPVQHLMWTWSVVFFHMFENATIVGAVLALARPKPLRSLALALCTVASFTRLEGLFGWIVLAPLYANAAPKDGDGRSRFSAWIIGAGVAWAGVIACTYIPVRDAVHAPLSTSDAAWSDKLLFVPSILGATPGYFVKAAFQGGLPTHAFVPAGVVVLASLTALALALARVPATRTAALPWLSLGAFALAFAGATAIGRVVGGASGVLLGAFQIQVFEIYVAAYSITASLATVSLLHLLYQYCASRPRVAGLPSRVFGALTAAAGLALVGANYRQAWPEMEERLLSSRWDTHCVELARYLAIPNSCLMPRGGADALAKAKLRAVYDDARFVEDRTDTGSISSVGWADDARGVRDRAVIVGVTWLLPEDVGGDVFLAFGGAHAFFARSARWGARRNGTTWVAIVPSDWVHGKTIVAWHYSPATHTFTRLKGQLSVQ